MLGPPGHDRHGLTSHQDAKGTGASIGGAAGGAGAVQPAHEEVPHQRVRIPGERVKQVEPGSPQQRPVTRANGHKLTNRDFHLSIGKYVCFFCESDCTWEEVVPRELQSVETSDLARRGPAQSLPYWPCLSRGLEET